jgi:hypothetical protein
MKINRKIINNMFLVALTAGLILSGCTPAALAVTVTPTSSVPPLPPTATPIPLPALSFTPGDPYFKLDGKPTFIFSRNLAGVTPQDYATLAGMAQKEDDLLLRVGTDNAAMGGLNGYGYTSSGAIVSNWDQHWENFFETAEEDGLYVLPTFTGWINWNDSGYNTWGTNPFNHANGGPASDPGDIYRKDSPTQKLYVQWFQQVVGRWSSHRNILGWEVVTEIDLINGITQADGIYLTEQLAAAARQADPLHRPVTASLAGDYGFQGWLDYYRSDAVDFINYHPYPASARLDITVLQQVRTFLNAYHKPVLIGESGLSAATPDTSAGKITTAKYAVLGVQHAVWAEAVSGAMNGRALWWEDSFGLYFSDLGLPFLQKYEEVEGPVVQFMQGVDVTSFGPVPAQASSQVVGAALGNETAVIGWFRDAGCEPPNWPLQKVISNQTVTLTVPGDNPNWRVDFYETKTGTTLLTSAFVTRSGQTITIHLPDFQDDIAFKLSGEK